MNAKTREKLLYIGFFVQKLGDIIDEERELSKTLQMAYNGLRSYFNKAVDSLTQDEKLKLKTDMERKYIQIDYKKRLISTIRRTDLRSSSSRTSCACWPDMRSTMRADFATETRKSKTTVCCARH